jgi:hypothetical protein
LSRALYEIHHLAHSVQPGTYQRHLGYTELVEMPTIVAEAFDVIADEANTILRENNGGSETRPDGRDKAQ